MENFQLIFGIIILTLVGFVIYKNAFNFYRISNLPKDKVKFDMIKPLFKKIAKGEIPEPKLLTKYAFDIKTREITYQLLKEYNRIDLFPKEFNTIEKGAETNLVNWLDFPGDLEKVPDEIEYIEKVNIDDSGTQLYYHTYKFKVYEPSYAAKFGWMIGTVGPYSDVSVPYEKPKVISSRFVKSKYGEVTPKEEVLWTHNNIYLKASTQQDI